MFGVRTVFIIAFILLLVWVIFSPILRLKKPPSVFWIAVTLIPLSILGFTEYKWLSYQAEGTKLVQKISEKPASYLECQRLTSALVDAQLSKAGMVYWDNMDRAIVKYEGCKLWAEFLDSDKRNLTDKQLWAVGTVIHEAYHVKGEMNEATTQCLTIKNFSNVLKNYNVPENLIAGYQERYLEASKRMPAEYLNGVC